MGRVGDVGSRPRVLVGRLNATERRPRTLILSGRERFADPWHDMAATSHQLALTLSALGEVSIKSTFAGLGLPTDDDDAAPWLADVDLLVLNISGRGVSSDDDEPAWAAVANRIANWARAGGRILAVHQTMLAAMSYPELAEVLGGQWVDDVSGHPPMGPMTLFLKPEIAGLPPEVHAFDERYCRLTVSQEINLLGWVFDDIVPGVIVDQKDKAGSEPQPALWYFEAHGGQSVYCSLGHDVRSYESAGHRDLLIQMARELLS